MQRGSKRLGRPESLRDARQSTQHARSGLRRSPQHHAYEINADECGVANGHRVVAFARLLISHGRWLAGRMLSVKVGEKQEATF